jgi:hypothetical protein
MCRCERADCATKVVIHHFSAFMLMCYLFPCKLRCMLSLASLRSRCSFPVLSLFFVFSRCFRIELLFYGFVECHWRVYQTRFKCAEHWCHQVRTEPRGSPTCLCCQHSAPSLKCGALGGVLHTPPMSAGQPQKTAQAADARCTTQHGSGK